MHSKNFVDYERVATLYEDGRQLPQEVLDRWRAAVDPWLPSETRVVVDLGAGTGIFARAWPQWTSASVVAVEPSDAMVHTGHLVDRKVHFVRATAEAVPLGRACVDVIWISTALHHFSDDDRAVAEISRVIVPKGRVLVRTYLPGRTEVTWLSEFPGREKWAARFHTMEELVALFSRHSLVMASNDDVSEWTEPYAKSAEWVTRMRHADSILTALSDDEIEEGLTALRSNPTKMGRLDLTLLVFERP